MNDPHCSFLSPTSNIRSIPAHISSDLLSVLVDGTCLLLKSKAREIVQAALGLLKVVLVVFPESVLAQFLHKLVSAFTSVML